MHNHNEFWWKFFPKNKLNQIYVALALRSFALSMVGIFLPLYLYSEIGYTFQQTLSFWIFFSIVLAIMSPVAAKCCSKFGIKHAVLFSMPIYILFLISLYFLSIIKMSLIIPATLAGFSVAFYWVGMHLLFHHVSDHKHRGEEFGKRKTFMIISSFFGPIFGGLLIKYVGFKFVFVFASFIFLISALVLFRSKEEHPIYHFSFRSIADKDHWKNSLFFVSVGTKTVATGVIWPMFIFLILGDYFVLGVVGSILAGVSALLVWFTGKYSDQVGKRKILRRFAGFEALSWVLRALVKTTTHVFGATIFGAITSGIMVSPMGALEYDKAKGNIAAYFVSREVFICLGRILLITFVMMTNSLLGGLLFHSFASLAVLLF